MVGAVIGAMATIAGQQLTAFNTRRSERRSSDGIRRQTIALLAVARGLFAAGAIDGKADADKLSSLVVDMKTRFRSSDIASAFNADELYELSAASLHADLAVIRVRAESQKLPVANTITPSALLAFRRAIQAAMADAYAQLLRAHSLFDSSISPNWQPRKYRSIEDLPEYDSLYCFPGLTGPKADET